MNALRNFFTPEAGQARTNWLNNVLQTYVADPVNYYLGPSGVPNRLQAAGNALQFTDAGDMPAAADAGRRLWNDPTIGNAAEYAAAGAAMMLPFYSARLGEGIADVADELVRGYDPNTLNAFRVWHGSPHDFDRFSMDKIGTGEGAQAYGHGLYFAEGPEIAKYYRDSLADVPNTPEGNVWDLVNRYGQNPDDLRGTVQDMVKFAPNETMKARAQEMLRVVNDGSWQNITPSGSLYEVAIDADPEDFLDWDAPLSAQPQVAERLGFASDSLASWEDVNRRYDDALLRALGGDTAAEAEATALLRQIEGMERTGVSRRGQDFLTTGSVFDSAAKPEVTKRLLEAGIPGVRYLDAGSRGADGGSRNYVLFDDNLATILSKNGEQVTTPEADRMRAEIDAFLSENGY